MKRLLLAVMLAFVLSTPLAWAGEPKMKMGLVDFQKALNEVEQGKIAKEDLKKDFDARQKKLDLMQSELKKMQEELENQRLVMSEETLMKKQEEYKAKYMDLQQKWMNFRQELGTREAEMSTKIITNLRVLVQEYGKKNNYTMVVESSQGGVVYVEGGDDLTQEIINMYNKRYKGKL